MKKKGIIISAIVGIVLLGVIGYNLYEAHKENEAKEVFLEWFQDIQAEDIVFARVYDGRYVENYDYHSETDLAEAKKKEICQAIKTISAKDVSEAQKIPEHT